MPALAVPLIWLGGLILGGIASFAAKNRVQNYLDPSDPGKHSAGARVVADVFRDRENASDWKGNEGIVAARAIQNIKPSVRLDIINSNMDPEVLRETLRKLQQVEVDKFRQNPSALSPWTILATPFRERNVLGNVEMAGEFLGRTLDNAVSRAAGYTDSAGRILARTELGLARKVVGEKAAGLGEDGPVFNIVSGSIDAAKIFFLDPTIVAGKVAKTARLAQVPGMVEKGLFSGAKELTALEKVISQPRAIRWVEEMTKVGSPTLVYESAIHNGGRISWDMAVEIANADNFDDAIKQFARVDQYHAVPQWTFMGKGQEPARSFVKRMPIIRAGQRTWDQTISIHHPDFVDDLRRLGEFMYDDASKARSALDEALTKSSVGVPSGGGVATQETRRAVSDRAELVKGMRKFFDDGMVAFAERKGVSPEQTRRAIAKLRSEGGGWFSHEEQAFGGAALPEHLRRAAGDLPLFETQLQYSITVPSYGDFMRLGAELSALPRVAKAGFKTEEFANALQRPLKQLWLMNPAYVARNAIEEMSRAAMDPEIGGAYLRRMRDQTLASMGRVVAPGGKFMRKGKLVDVPADDAYKAFVAERVGKASLPLYLRSARDMARKVKFDGPPGEEALRAMKKEGTWDGYHWNYFTRNEPGYLLAWHHAVNNHALGDRVSQMLLAYWDEPDEAARVISNWFKTPEGLNYVKQFSDVDDPMQLLGAGRELIRQMVPESLLPYARKGSIPWEALRDNVFDGPELIYGPSLVNDTVGSSSIIARTWNKAGNKFFGAAGGTVDALARNKMHQVAKELEFKRILDVAGESNLIGKTVSMDDIEAAAQRFADRKVFALADTPGNRTRFDFWVKTWIPFSDAQVRFWKRWGKLAMTDPAAVEKMRLLMGAGEDMGWLEEDDRGQVKVNLPIAAPFFSVLTHLPSSLSKEGFSSVPTKFTKDWLSLVVDRRPEGDAEQIGKSVVPAGIPFGIDVLPGFSPFVTLPAAWLTAERPSLKWLRSAIFGGGMRSAGANIAPDADVPTAIVDAVMTGWQEKLMRGVFSRDRDVAFGNSLIEAMQAQAYLGKDVTDPKVQDEARAWAKKMWVVRSMQQFISPYTPSALPFGKDLIDDYRELRTQYGPEVGTVKFLEKWGDKAFGYTVAKSKSNVGAPLAVSKESEAFYQKNKDFFRLYPDVGGFFTRDLEGEFDSDALAAQIRRGQRVTLPPVEWLADAMYRFGNKEYYDKVKPAYDKFLSEGGDPSAASEWLQQKRLEVDAKYPGWLEAWAGWAQRQERREGSIRSLAEAIKDPAVAKTATAKATQRFFDSYFGVLAEVQSKGYKTLQSRRLSGVRAALARDAHEIMGEIPSRGFEAIYSYLFQRDLEEFDVQELRVG